MQRANPYRWTLIALCVLAVSTLGIAFTPTTTVRADDDFKSLKKEYETAKREDSRTAMGRIVEKMGATNDKDAAKYLLGELADDQGVAVVGGIDADPHDRHVRAAVGVDGGEVGQMPAGDGGSGGGGEAHGVQATGVGARRP